MLKTRALDRINFCSLQTKGFWPSLGFILSKTRALDRINFFSLQIKVLHFDRINFSGGRRVEGVEPKKCSRFR